MFFFFFWERYMYSWNVLLITGLGDEEWLHVHVPERGRNPLPYPSQYASDAVRIRYWYGIDMVFYLRCWFKPVFLTQYRSPTVAILPSFPTLYHTKFERIALFSKPIGCQRLLAVNSTDKEPTYPLAFNWTDIIFIHPTPILNCLFWGGPLKKKVCFPFIDT